MTKAIEVTKRTLKREERKDGRTNEGKRDKNFKTKKE